MASRDIHVPIINVPLLPLQTILAFEIIWAESLLKSTLFPDLSVISKSSTISMYSPFNEKSSLSLPKDKVLTPFATIVLEVSLLPS